jgi:hypothetical protein
LQRPPLEKKPFSKRAGDMTLSSNPSTVKKKKEEDRGREKSYSRKKMCPKTWRVLQNMRDGRSSGVQLLRSEPRLSHVLIVPSWKLSFPVFKIRIILVPTM